VPRLNWFADPARVFVRPGSSGNFPSAAVCTFHARGGQLRPHLWAPPPHSPHRGPSPVRGAPSLGTPNRAYSIFRNHLAGAHLRLLRRSARPKTAKSARAEIRIGQ